jgi:hypothetical protein
MHLNESIPFHFHPSRVHSNVSFCLPKCKV